MNRSELIDFCDMKIDECRKHINNSYSSKTRYKWMDIMSKYEDLRASARCFEELMDYRRLDEKCRQKYGVNIAKQLGI